MPAQRAALLQASLNRLLLLCHRTQAALPGTFSTVCEGRQTALRRRLLGRLDQLIHADLPLRHIRQLRRHHCALAHAANNIDAGYMAAT